MPEKETLRRARGAAREGKSARRRLEKVALYLNDLGKTVNARKRRALRRARRALERLRARSASGGV